MNKVDGQRLVYQFADVPKNIIEIDCGEDLSTKKIRGPRQCMPRPYNFPMPSQTELQHTAPAPHLQRRIPSSSPPPLVPTVLDNMSLSSPRIHSSANRSSIKGLAHSVIKENIPNNKTLIPAMIKDEPNDSLSSLIPRDYNPHMAAANLSAYRESIAERIKSDDEETKMDTSTTKPAPKQEIVESGQVHTSVSALPDDNADVRDDREDIDVGNAESDCIDAHSDDNDEIPQRLSRSNGADDSLPAVDTHSEQIPRLIQHQDTQSDDDSESEQELMIDDTV